MQTSLDKNQYSQTYKKDSRFNTIPSHNSWNNSSNDYRSMSGNPTIIGGGSRFPSHSTTISHKSSNFSYNNLPTFMKSSNLLKPSKSSITSSSTGFRVSSSNSEPLPFVQRRSSFDFNNSNITQQFNPPGNLSKYGNMRIHSDGRKLFNSPRTKESINTGNKLFRVFTSESQDNNKPSSKQQQDSLPLLNSSSISQTRLDSTGPGATTLGDHELDPEVEFLNFLKCIFLISFQLLRKGLLWGLIFLKFAAGILVTYINNIPDLRSIFGFEVDQIEELDNEDPALNKGEDKAKTLLSKLIPTGFSTPLTNSTKKVMDGFSTYNNTIDDTPSVPRKSTIISLNPSDKTNKLASLLQKENGDSSEVVSHSANYVGDYGSRFFSSNKLDADAQLQKTAKDNRFKPATDTYDFETNHSNTLESFRNTMDLESIPAERLTRVKATLKNVLSKAKNGDEGSTQDEKVQKIIKNVNQIFDRKFRELNWVKNDTDDYVLHLNSTELYKNYQKIMEERAKLKKLISLITGKKERVAPLLNDQLSLITSYFRSPMLQNKIIDAYNVPISVRDIQTLRDGRWLNDNIIDFYLSMIVDRSKQPAKSSLPKVFAFTTHFYSTLSSRGYQGVARWAKRAKVDVTAMDYVFIPVNLHESHWALSVINNKAKKFQYFDSLFGSGTHVLESLASYMVQESKRLYGADGNGVDYFNYKLDDALVTPKQENGYDCGVFTCTTAEFLSRESPLTFSQNDMPVLRERMAYEICTKNLLT